jgi:WD40 repeat protein
MLKVIIFSLLLLFPSAGFNTEFGTNQVMASVPPLAAYGEDGNLYLYGFEDDPIQITFQNEGLGEIQWHPGGTLHDLSWSPDGRYLAFIDFDRHLAVFDIQTRQIENFDVYPSKELQIIFDNSSQYLLYGAGGERVYETEYEDFYELNINRIAVTGNDEPQLLTTIGTISSVYGGFEILLSETIYRGEMGGYGTFGDRILADTPFGLIAVSPGYVSDREETVEAHPAGINLYHDDSVINLMGQSVRSAVISDDHKKLAIISGETITVLDLETFDRTSFELHLSPQIVTWGENNSIYYTTVAPTRDLLAELTVEERDALLTLNQFIFDYEPLTSNLVSIHQLDLTDGTEHVIYQSEAYAIGQLAATPDDAGLFFSIVPNMDVWIDALIVSKSVETDVSESFNPSLYYLDLQTLEVELVASGLYKSTINFPRYME